MGIYCAVQVQTIWPDSPSKSTILQVTWKETRSLITNPSAFSSTWKSIWQTLSLPVGATWCTILEEENYGKKVEEWTRWEGCGRSVGQDWHAKKSTQTGFRLCGGTEGFRDNTCFKQKKKERKWGTKEHSVLRRTVNPVPLSCPPPLPLCSLAAGSSVNISLWMGTLSKNHKYKYLHWQAQ